MSKMRFRDYWRIHIDIPTIAIVVFVISIIYRPLANFVFGKLSTISQRINVSEWSKDVGLNVLSEGIAIVIFAAIGWVVFKTKSKPFYAGKFKAYDIKESFAKKGDC